MSALLSLTLFGQEVEAVKVLRRLLVLSAKLYLKRHMVIAPRPLNVPLLTYTTPEGELFTGYRYTAPELNILSREYEFALDPRIIIEVSLRPDLPWWKLLIQGIATGLSYLQEIELPDLQTLLFTSEYWTNPRKLIALGFKVWVRSCDLFCRQWPFRP